MLPKEESESGVIVLANSLNFTDTIKPIQFDSKVLRSDMKGSAFISGFGENSSLTLVRSQFHPSNKCGHTLEETRKLCVTITKRKKKCNVSFFYCAIQ